MERCIICIQLLYIYTASARHKELYFVGIHLVNSQTSTALT